MTISDRAKEQIAPVLKAGETAVDATMGKGWDTLFLAEKVGPSGKVYAFDVQSAAVDETRKRLQRAECLEQCELLLQGHERMAELVPPGVGGAMFNLGYLPYADQAIVTREETTITALEAASTLLRAGGVLTVICYRGHPGGQEEAGAVLGWAQGKREDFEVDGPEKLPEGEKPFLLVLRKISSAS